MIFSINGKIGPPLSTVLRRLAGFESKNKPVWQGAKPVSTRFERLASGQTTTTGAPTLTLE
ncbi:MAG: hypothetical protein DLM68_16140 [Hyphomicrobiales bacterium]|nr:MAG: hypothetical protein DLM68_16140 [Hyphomicrobiales bacterium]